MNIGSICKRHLVTVDGASTLQQAAQLMREHHMGSLVVIVDRLSERVPVGMLTDRDITVEVVAKGKDPDSTKVSELANGKPVTIGADDPVEEALATMKEHQVRRLPVIDGHDLIGIVSQADVARNLPEDKVGDLVEAISQS
jgi:CBS domain-containing protein